MIPPRPASRVRLLYRLQQVDSEFARTEERLRTLDPGGALRSRQQEAEAALAAAQEELAARQSRARDLELELQSTDGKRKKMEEEMYSGRVRNPKELAAMQEDVAALGRRARHLEDEILALLEETEAEQANVQALVAEGRAARAEWERHVAAYERERESLEAAREELGRQRVEVAATIDQDHARALAREADARDVPPVESADETGQRRQRSRSPGSRVLLGPAGVRRARLVRAAHPQDLAAVEVVGHGAGAGRPYVDRDQNGWSGRHGVCR